MNIEEFINLDFNNIQLVDIREQTEWDNDGKIKEARLIPKDKLLSNIWLFDIKKPVYLICHTGLRTSFMVLVLKSLGWEAISINGGMEEYLKLTNK